MVEIPVVSLKSPSAGAAFTAAASMWGFVQIEDHGIPRDTFTSMFNLAKDFFSKSQSEKMQLATKYYQPENANYYRGYFPVRGGDAAYKEGFECGPISGTCLDAPFPFGEPSVWPADESFRIHLRSYFDQLQTLGMRLIQFLSNELCWDEQVMVENFRGSLSTLRLIHYPLRPDSEPNALSTPEHADSGVLTLLVQDDAGGLQVKAKNGDWVDVPPHPDRIIVNSGGLLQQWSDGHLPSTIHRVTAVKKDRYSIPFFFEPHFLARGPKRNGDSYGTYLLSQLERFVEYKEFVAAFRNSQMKELSNGND